MLTVKQRVELDINIYILSRSYTKHENLKYSIEISGNKNLQVKKNYKYDT
jgi:hypothetical protein